MNGQDLELQFPRPVKLATQVAEINEHLVEIIEHLGGQTDGNNNCKEDIAEIQRLLKEIQADLTTLGSRIDGIEDRVAALEEGGIPPQINRKLDLISHTLLNLKGIYEEDKMLALEKLYSLAFAPEGDPSQVSIALYKSLAQETELKDTLNECRKAQELTSHNG